MKIVNILNWRISKAYKEFEACINATGFDVDRFLFLSRETNDELFALAEELKSHCGVRKVIDSVMMQKMIYDKLLKHYGDKYAQSPGNVIKMIGELNTRPNPNLSQVIDVIQDLEFML